MALAARDGKIKYSYVDTVELAILKLYVDKVVTFSFQFQGNILSLQPINLSQKVSKRLSPIFLGGNKNEKQK